METTNIVIIVIAVLSIAGAFWGSYIGSNSSMDSSSGYSSLGVITFSLAVLALDIIVALSYNTWLYFK